MNILRVSFLLILLGSTVLPGCNTVEGVGKDVQQGGKAIQDAAEDGHH